MNTKLRRSRVVRAVRSAGLDALLVTHPADVRYLCGFTGSSAALALFAKGSVLFTDGRYTEQAKQECAGVRVVITKGPALAGACEWIGGAGVERCGYDPANTTVAALSAMRASVAPKLRRSLFRSAESMVSRQREIKDDAEILAMRRAAAVGCSVFDEVLRELTTSATEIDVSLLLYQHARSHGAEGMSFESIVAGGPRSALPHARPTPEKLPKRGFLTLDFGVVVDGYCSDMTRSVHFGRVSPEARSVYDSVLEAQMRAIARVAPGITAGDVDDGARSVLRRSGLGDYFTHSTGHGLGLEIHEQPRIAAKQKQQMEPGMIITIEPGVYLEGRFGVRIEDMVLVTDRGHEVLTDSTKALIEL